MFSKKKKKSAALSSDERVDEFERRKFVKQAAMGATVAAAGVSVSAPGKARHRRRVSRTDGTMRRTSSSLVRAVPVMLPPLKPRMPAPAS